MKKTHINWIKCSDEQPKESKHYLAMSKCGYIQFLPFSTVHQSWNNHDSDESDRVLEYSLTESIKYWAEPSYPEGMEDYRY